MRPQFRSDLKASREEQQGVVFYRIDDPQTQTSFRLYEIEYLIARKLDGTRTLDEVIGAVKAEYNFDITGPDLKKFVSQLESMGFISGVGAAAPLPGAAASLPPDDSAPTVPVGAMAREVAASVQARAAGGSPPSPPPDDLPQAVTVDEDADTSVMELDEAVPLEDEDSISDVGPPEDAFNVPTVERPHPSAASSYGYEDSSGGGNRDEGRFATGPEEVLHMLRSAFEHLRQGYVIHARDYFNAARESRPEDERLKKLANHLAMTPDDASPDEVQELWTLGRDLFPEIASDVEIAAAGTEPAMSEEPLRSRLLWTLALLVVVGVGLASLGLLAKKMRIFEGAVQVQVASLTAERLPLFYEQAALSVEPQREQTLKATAKGKLHRVPAAGTRVEQGDIVVMFALPPKVEEKLEEAKDQLEKAKAAYAKAAEKLEEVIKEREQVRVERDEAEAELKELRPKSILKSGGVSTRDMEKYRRIMVKAQKKLGKLAKKERKPRAAERKAKQKVDQALKRLEQVEERLAGKIIRAPFAGVVSDVKAKAGDNVAPDAELLTLRDPNNVIVAFDIPAPGDLQPGGEVYVAVDGAAPTAGKVATIVPQGGKTRLEVRLNDPAGAFVEAEAQAFKLVKEFAEPAFSVDSRAIVEPEGEPARVYVAIAGRAAKRDVEVLSRNPNRSVIRALNGNLRDGDQLVVAAPQSSVATLLDDTAVEVAGP